MAILAGGVVTVTSEQRKALRVVRLSRAGVPQWLAQAALGVSHVRIVQLLDAGILRPVTFLGVRWVSSASVLKRVSYLRKSKERKALKRVSPRQ